MRRSFALRPFLLAAVLIPGLAILGLSRRADAQPGGMRIEKIWVCSKCGGSLGNGASPPSTCWRCNAKLSAPTTNDNWYGDSHRSRDSGRQSRDASKDEGWSVGRVFAVSIGIAVVIALGFYVMKDWSH